MNQLPHGTSLPRSVNASCTCMPWYLCLLSTCLSKMFLQINNFQYTFNTCVENPTISYTRVLCIRNMSLRTRDWTPSSLWIYSRYCLTKDSSPDPPVILPKVRLDRACSYSILFFTNRRYPSEETHFHILTFCILSSQSGCIHMSNH